MNCTPEVPDTFQQHSLIHGIALSSRSNLQSLKSNITDDIIVIFL